MLKLAIGLFLLLHGLIHGWYVVLSQGWVEIEDQMGWNGESWLLSTLLPQGAILNVASVLYIVATLGFVVGGIGYALEREWSTMLLVSAAVLSSLVIVAMWDGRPTMLVEKGIVGVVINLAVVYLLVFR